MISKRATADAIEVIDEWRIRNNVTAFEVYILLSRLRDEVDGNTSFTQSMTRLAAEWNEAFADEEADSE